MNISPDMGPIPEYSSPLLGISKKVFEPHIPNESIGEKTSPQEFWGIINEIPITPFHKFDMRFEECRNKEEVISRFFSLLSERLGMQIDDQTSLNDIYEAVPDKSYLSFTALLRHWLTKST